MAGRLRRVCGAPSSRLRGAFVASHNQRHTHISTRACPRRGVNHGSRGTNRCSGPGTLRAPGFVVVVWGGAEEKSAPRAAARAAGGAHFRVFQFVRSKGLRLCTLRGRRSSALPGGKSNRLLRWKDRLGKAYGGAPNDATGPPNPQAVRAVAKKL